MSTRRRQLAGPEQASPTPKSSRRVRLVRELLRAHDLRLQQAQRSRARPTRQTQARRGHFYDSAPEHNGSRRAAP
jgi:hypothetical protein